MPKFRKKPVVVEAFQMTQPHRWQVNEWPPWLRKAKEKGPGEGGVWLDPDLPLEPNQEHGGELVCGTLAGVAKIPWDWWIIRGVEHELYPCSPDIFEMTYEPVAAVARAYGVMEAFQMTRERRWDNSKWPQWVNEAWNKEPGEGAVWIDPDAPIAQGHKSAADLVCGTVDGVCPIGWNDWLIKGAKGDIYPVTPVTFAEMLRFNHVMYDTVEEAEELKEVTAARKSL